MSHLSAHEKCERKRIEPNDLDNEKKENEERIKAMKTELIKIGGEEKDKFLQSLESTNIVLLNRTVRKINLMSKNPKLVELARQSVIYFDKLQYNKLEYATQCYFSNFFGSSLVNIEFIEKTESTHIGRLIIVDIGDKKILFHAKTHRNGAIITANVHFSRVSCFDPKELFVYSLFQFLGLGPEVHFFGLDEKDFFICTKHVPNFKTCDQMQELIVVEPQYTTLCNELVKLDIVSRILTLSDTTTNLGNFAFSYFSPSNFKLMVFDFAVNDRELYNNPIIVENFICGNGLLDYALSESTLIKFALHTREAKERKKIAIEYLTNLTFIECVEKANSKIEGILNSSLVSGLKENEKNKMKYDLRNYKSGIISNFELFMKY